MDLVTLSFLEFRNMPRFLSVQPETHQILSTLQMQVFLQLRAMFYYYVYYFFHLFLSLLLEVLSFLC